MLQDFSLDRAISWLLHSGIQKASFGVARYYRSSDAVYRPVSTEITGYTVSALAYLHSLTGRDDLVHRMHGTADFLCAQCTASPPHVFPFELADGHSGQAYFFDTGIIIRGLLSAYRSSNSPDWLTVAEASARGMIAAYGGGRTREPVLELPSLQAAPRQPRWSRMPGCYQLKSALAWREVSALTQQRQFHDHWASALAAARANAPDFLPGDPDSQRVMDRLHAFCYYLEALVCDGPPGLHAHELSHGIARVESYLRAAEGDFVRSDVYAQLLRVRLFAQPHVPLNLPAAEHEARVLATFQAASPDRRIDGGFWFGRSAAGVLPFVNPVSTIFATQALLMWQQYRLGSREWPVESLI